jgi:hypothetical protein
MSEIGTPVGDILVETEERLWGTGWRVFDLKYGRGRSQTNKAICRDSRSAMAGSSMDEKGFRKFVKEGKRVPKGLSEATIRSHIRMVKEFEAFLSRKGPRREFNDAGDRDVEAFVKHLAKDDRATFDNFIGLLRYSRFSGNGKLELSLIEMLDGSSVMGKLCDNVKRKCGKRRHDEILRGFTPPPPGTSPKQMPKATTDFLNRLESKLSQAETRDILLDSPHAGLPEYYADEKKMLKASKNVDEYLRRRRKKFIDELTGHMKNGTLFYTQAIDQEVLDFVKRNPEIAGGVRKGNTIFCTKVPYMAIEYLREKDKKLRRYYYCHCPLARESIMSGKEMSHNLCYCSAGYEKRPFDVAFGEPVKVEVLESVLWGDLVCRFALEIPEAHRM